MKRKSSKYLEFYKECMKTGLMPQQGLCANFPDDSRLDLFNPTPTESFQLRSEGKFDGYWASGQLIAFHNENVFFEFSSFRQTVVLFMHNMKINPIL